MSRRILMTLDAAGGVWRYTMELGAALARRGHQLALAGAGPAPTADQRAEAAELGDLSWSDEPLDWMVADRTALANIPSWLAGLIARHEPDILHFNLPSLAAALPQDSPPSVVVCHSCMATWFRTVERRTIPDQLAWHALLTRRGLVKASAVVAPSRAHAELTRAVYRTQPIQVVPNASTAPLKAPSMGNGSIVAVGRWWDKGKNGAVLAAVAARVEAPVVLIGPCEGGAGEAFRAKHAHLEHALSHEETLARVAGASIFVSPSCYEPFGLAALEAARAGRPLLLADIPVYREIWDGAAWFFAPSDPDELARQIRALLAQPDKRLHLGLAAQARALTFSPAMQASVMETIYEKLLAQPQGD
ncbi:glycosyltransferase family 4 protein [Salipiger sp. PrR007]|uniref:glycosyltransferase family 4 protein n=1 Tax=Salipiger sp. PrR007 TaxID=2706884 RepID=UPI0013B7589D|nr:glycosyltransferase family 4 protein [Salipiger sp. PrR007]NDW32758.1 glycosyltransferase family 4 protein [Salipiger sp. PrR007]